jgi:F-type H+-transporting ATPase subunit delta
MALNRSTARRYAEAAFQIAERDGTVDAWLAALSLAEERLADPAVERLLTSPAIAPEARIAVMERLLGPGVGGAPRNLLALLVRRGRITQLPAVARELRRLHARREGIVEAVVTSASPLGEAEREALRERLQSLTGSRIQMSLEVDPALLGGLQVLIGDRLIDGTVRGRLERLRASFSTTAI